MNEKPTKSGCWTAFVGAVVANVVVITGVFTVGAIFGAAPPDFSGGRMNMPTRYGLDGGGVGLGHLALVSVLTAGVLPLLISAVGVVIALIRRRRSVR